MIVVKNVMVLGLELPAKKVIADYLNIKNMLFYEC